MKKDIYNISLSFACLFGISDTAICVQNYDQDTSITKENITGKIEMKTLKKHKRMNANTMPALSSLQKVLDVQEGEVKREDPKAFTVHPKGEAVSNSTDIQTPIFRKIVDQMVQECYFNKDAESPAVNALKIGFTDIMDNIDIIIKKTFKDVIQQSRTCSCSDEFDFDYVLCNSNYPIWEKIKQSLKNAFANNPGTYDDEIISRVIGFTTHDRIADFLILSQERLRYDFVEVAKELCVKVSDEDLELYEKFKKEVGLD